ncbi:MAG: undecaprenyldiphospho-muramoylpentapeptide beta-N-acetylglucosaminyltransferase [Saprospiraceae bacterium]|nr:undecaprenyldiphospho-muramoylpentapeptide beta-N-acetylglucosaminyltransferase [Saprospiraceae bacterium]
MKVLISGGGTGGHVFPAIAIANALKSKIPDIDILFVGANGKMEMYKVPQAGYRIVGLPIRGLKRTLSLDHIRWSFLLLFSMMKAAWTVFKFKPDVAVGVGGYASGPVLRMASWIGIPILIQEQNSYPGITNKLLAKSALKICVAFEGLEKYFPEKKIMITGNPVRQDLLISQDPSEAKRFFQLDPQKTTICVFGGSLGARAINESLISMMDKLSQQNNWQWLWQYGSGYESELKEILKKCPNHVKFFPFIERMDLAYAAADIVISRAGALTLAELMVTGKASVLIPSPNVAEDHQRKNAQYLVDQSAAYMILEQDVKQELWPTLERLLSNEALLNEMKIRINELAKPMAAKSIADEIIKIGTPCS